MGDRLRASGRLGRTPSRSPYHVHYRERWEVGGVYFNFTAVETRCYLLVSVYESFSGRFWCSLRLPLPGVCRVHRTTWETYVMSFLEKSRPSKAGPVAFIQANCPWLSKSCPALHEYLTVGELPGGEVRQTSTVTIFTEGGLWKACLSERDAEATLFASGDTVESCLDNLEERLKAPHVDWRRKGQKGDGKPQKRS